MKKWLEARRKQRAVKKEDAATYVKMRAGRRVMITNDGFFHGQKGTLTEIGRRPRYVYTNWRSGEFTVRLDFSGDEKLFPTREFKTITEDDYNIEVSAR